MPRNLYRTEPTVINQIERTKKRTGSKYLEVATSNKKKLKEFSRVLTDYEIIGKNFDIEEIQSNDPIKVIKQKAKGAYEQNKFNPILVEDTSLEIKGLHGRPGTYVKDFCAEAGMRKIIVEEWLKNKDRSAVARVLLGLFDGMEVHIWEGKTQGRIAKKLRGTNGFGWDDIFIPKGQKTRKARTFAEMQDKEKDKYSMRKKALNKFLSNPVEMNYPVFRIPEPYEQEMKRVQPDKLQQSKAIEFAFQLECLEQKNSPNKSFKADKYTSLVTTQNPYFTRFLTKPNTKSIGLILTDVDRKRLKFYKNGDPVLWQMGPERRFLALAQRTEYFMHNQNEEIHEILDDLENRKSNFPKRNNLRSPTIDKALEVAGATSITKALSLREIGYKKISADKYVSRTKSAKYGLFNIVGKYARSIYGVGCLPWVSGWRDVIVTSAIGHIPVFVHRNNINAIDFRNQIDLIKESKKVIAKLKLSKKGIRRAYQNIGAAIGCHPMRDLERAKRLYKEAGIKLFRIYTINSDPRVIETAHALRKYFGDEIEIFVGQLVDKKQCKQLIQSDINVDGLIFGHGGGRQCTSATNGMALSTLEEIYSITTDKKFNNTSLLVEGGIGSYVGGLLVMGVDCILRNAQFANCVIEQGDTYFEYQDGRLCQPYHGSASAPTMIIESFNKENAEKKLFYSGRTKNVEGTSGYIFYKEKANSMTFYINQFKHYAARTLADMGVDSLWELRDFLQSNEDELLRVVSQDAAYTASAWNQGQ
ncbi:hypothetical protein GF362_03880 [Candidatus Dojkabacteria bacterium]|nr:hypothetical protein [Candidatus Dojkabacteria bacterium]